MEKFFISIYHFFQKRKTAFFVTFVLCFLSVAYFALQVKFEEDIAAILPKDEKTEKINQALQQAKFTEKLVITISFKDTTAEASPDLLIAYTDSLIKNIQEKLPQFVAEIKDKVEDTTAIAFLGTINQHLPVFLNEKDYTVIDSLITEAQLEKTLEQNFRILTSPAGITLKQLISNDPVGITFLALQKLQQLQYDENFELYDNHVVTKDHKHLLLFLTPAYPPNNTGKNAKLLQELDDIIHELNAVYFPQTTASYFGTTAVSVGNALQLRKDALITQGITILFIIVFLGIYFRQKRAPLLILIPVLFGAAFSLAAIYFIKGSISVIALGAGSLVLGIAVNYSLHVFNHYRHTKNIDTLLKDLVHPMTIGSFTTIGGFLCLQLVQSEMLKDLGLFAALSLIGASLASLIFLPHFIITKKQKTVTIQNNFSWLDKIAAYRPEYNKYLVALIFILTIVFAFFARKVNFESDLLRVNFMTEKLTAAEKQLNAINQQTLQSVYLISEGKTLQEALINNEKLVKKIEGLETRQIVKKYAGVSSLIISDSLQRARIEKWKQYWTSEKKNRVLATLYEKGRQLKFNASAFDNFKLLLNKDMELADSTAISAIRKNLLDDYINEKKEQTIVTTLLKTTAGDKEKIYRHFENDSLVTVFDKQSLTGKLVGMINADFSRIALTTSVLVFIVLLLMYGRIELSLVSFIPMFISWIWILGLMSLLGISFNIINIIVSALIFGLGDDYSLFIMDGLLQEYKTGKKNLSSFKSSIFLSAITTIAGLGVLVFAQHPALKSIALISIIGIVCVVTMSQILIPFFFSILIKNRTEKKLFPWTLTGFLKSAFAFSYFIGGSLLLSAIGKIFLLLRVKEKGKYFYHVLVSNMCRSLMYIMVNVKKKIINPQQEDFSKPAIIIANHQSSLDILPLIMLHPKLIMFTNNRIWNSRLFSSVIRMAEYFPAERVENDIDIVAKRIQHGYSVIIFPEGTRSLDGSVKRFHKGAFYLAEKLQVDVLPIMIHGTAYTLTKQDKLLKDGQVTLQFLPRIKPGDIQFGNGYSERAKLIGRYFREEFNQLKTSIEQPTYFREQLMYNYLYKGPVLEWYMRIKTKLEKNYKLFHELVPQKGKILDIGCGYGFMTYMLSFAASKREITGIDYDEKKIATANHCFSKTSTIHFICSDILNFAFEQYDAIILADVLHYLQPNEQKQVIEKCIDYLQPGGKIIIRDGDKDFVKRHKGTVLTEFFSTQFFRFNKTAGNKLSFLSGSEIKQIAAQHKMMCREIDQAKFTSNIIFILEKNNNSSHEPV